MVNDFGGYCSAAVQVNGSAPRLLIVTSWVIVPPTGSVNYKRINLDLWQCYRVQRNV